MTLTDQQIAAQLHNTELALYHLAALFKHLQPPAVQNTIDEIMSEYSDAMEACGSRRNPVFCTLEKT